MKNANKFFAAALLCLSAMVLAGCIGGAQPPQQPNQEGLVGAVTPTDISGVKYDPKTHAGTHLSNGADPVAGATSSIGGLMSAADKALFDKCLTDGPRNCSIDLDDFISGGADTTGASTLVSGVPFGTLQWFVSVTNSGTAKLVTTAQDSAHYGILQLETVTSTASTSGVRRMSSGPTPTFTFGTPQSFYHEWEARVPTLSDGTNTYVDQFGFANNIAATPTDGVFWEYSSASPSSGNWIGRTCAASSCTTVSSVAVTVAANTWYRLGFGWDGTTVTFLADGSSIGTTTSTIPTAVVGEFAQQLRSAGTASRTLLLDWFFQRRNILRAP